ncbi:uncharacterized protein BXZ73DRAFT_77118 [Epithele typhae]|uniref:uncharacterized protein n=1 Tax=Epithele typhae TaxID=378194 RepID=UPI0020088CCC|nr:uncharacterized protein BXZ73DRAFT_77118 [Epithele typhae]KAH9934016.1 hypothetical protein BXZ73DRAFT_77118 [Epithele typhae]
MLTPIILGADKTTVSVATGNQEYHPVYMSLGNIHNTMRRAHRESVIPVAFLPIPKALHGWEDDEEFRLFKKKLYHACLAAVLEPLRPGMEAPGHVLRCPDGHFRRAIFQVGPFIADYPEQVYLSGIVSGWCFAIPNGNFQKGDPRTHQGTSKMCDTYTHAELWDAWGINSDIQPFTKYFPRADIHELLTPDLLHQLIKGTFKDHVVAWVIAYIKQTNPDDEAKAILDDIDRRIAAVPPFPGLRRFHEGWKFKQWTGDDTKALMRGTYPTRWFNALRLYSTSATWHGGRPLKVPELPRSSRYRSPGLGRTHPVTSAESSGRTHLVFLGEPFGRIRLKVYVKLQLGSLAL